MPPYTYLNRPAAQALYQALIAEDPFYITLENRAHPAQAQEAMVRYMDFSMAEAQENGLLVLPPDQCSGAAIWAKPLAKERTEALSKAKKAFLRTHLGEESLGAYTRIVTFMAGQSQNLIPDTAWYLSILGVAPALQGQGLGGRMLRPTLAQADDLGLFTYIESFTPSNFGFYEHLGFKTAKTVLEPETQTPYAIMVREPGHF